MNFDIRYDFDRKKRIGLVEAIWGQDKNIDQLKARIKTDLKIAKKTK